MTEQHDQTLFRFYQESVEDREQTAQIGSLVFKSVDMVEIRAMGSKDFMSKRVDKIKQYDPPMWNRLKAHYEAWQRGQDAPLDGIPLKEWPLISAHHCRTLMEHGVKTVQQLAKINDETMKLIPMEGRKLQQRAEAYLSADRTAERTAVQVSDLKEQMARMQAELKAAQDMNAELAAGMEKRQPGRPRKTEDALA